MTTTPPAGPKDANPYAPPLSALSEVDPLEYAGTMAEAEATRRDHIRHETMMRSLGSIHLVAAFFGFLGGLGLFNLLLLRPDPGADYDPAIASAFLLWSGLSLAIGAGLRRLQPWARLVELAILALLILSLIVVTVAGVVVALTSGARPEEPLVLGLAGAAVALLLIALFIRLISPSAGFVFTREYRAVVEQTPHITRRPSVPIMLGLAMLVSFVVLGLAAALMR